MADRNILSSARHRSLQGVEGLRSFGRWWLNEFLALFPLRVSDWLTEQGKRVLVIAPDDNAIAFYLMSDRRRQLASAYVNQDDYAPALIDTFLKSNKYQRNDVSIGIRMPPETVFLRNFFLPLEVGRVLDTAVMQDMVAKTPFQNEDVHHAHAARWMDGRIAVEQWIVRRKHVGAAAEQLGLDPSEVAFVEPQAGNDSAAPMPAINVQGAPPDRSRWARRACLFLAIASPLLGATAGGLKYSNQQAMLDGLDAEVSAARSKAQRTLTLMKALERDEAGLQRIRHRHANEPGLLEIWEEVTRLLPSHSWLTELRLSEVQETRQVVMTGFSRAAAALVPLIDRSALFSEASLIAPISFDQAEDRERFSIQVNVKSPQKSRTASQ